MLSRWIRREPVRLYLYSALTLMIGALVLRGLISGEDGVSILGTLAVALIGVPATEAARSSVTPVASLPKR